MNIIIAFLISVLTLFTVPPYATYENNDTTLDTPIVELNNHTLREVFESDNAILGVGKNLFDKNAIDNLANYYLIETGRIISSASNYYSMTDFVNVKPSSSYRQNNGANSAVYACYYDINKNLISCQALNVGVLILNTPINCQYLRTTFINSHGTFDTLQIEQGTVATAYEPYKSTALGDEPPFISYYGQDYFGIETLTVSQLDYYYSLYRELIDFDGATITYLEYDLHDIALIIFFGFLWLSLIILIKRKVLI